jgi:hypothetical protein
MSNRYNRLAAPLALALMSATHAFAVTLSVPAIGTSSRLNIPTLKFPICYTRAIFASPSGQTTSQLIARQCEAGEKSGSVRVVYAG